MDSFIPWGLGSRDWRSAASPWRCRRQFLESSSLAPFWLREPRRPTARIRDFARSRLARLP